MDDLDVAAMLCSLMCHDLVSPVGALVNGVEILEEEEDKKIQEQALGLLSHSAEEASFRLQFFRLAFGASGGIGAEIHLGEAHRVLGGLYSNGRVQLNWEAPQQALEKTIVKLALNMAFAGGESLGRGGTVSVSVVVGGDGDTQEIDISISVDGDNPGLKENCKGLLTGEIDLDELTTRNVQPYYTYRLAERLGAHIEVDDSAENALSIRTHISEIA
jgi:histidine phosphotransferase ChpT